MNLFDQGALARQGMAAKGKPAKPYPDMSAKYFNSKPKTTTLEKSGKVSRQGTPNSNSSGQSDHGANLDKPLAQLNIPGLTPKTKMQRIYTYTKVKGQKEEEYSPAAAISDALYDVASGTIIAEESYTSRDTNADKTPVTITQLQTFEKLSGKGKPPKYFIRRSVSERVTEQLKTMREAVGGKAEDGSQVIL